MKKLLALVLVLMMVASFAAANAASGQLVVGSTTELSGDFFTTMWGNNASDNSVKQLIHGNSSTVWTKSDGYAVNGTAVKEFTTSVDEEGNKTYTFKIADDLVWNDGTPITAKDYVFARLLATSPAMNSLGAQASGGIEIVGYEDYYGDVTPNWTGVRLIDDMTYSITIKAQYLPYFYELSLVGVTPYPMHVLAPGGGVADDGNGAYFTGEANAATFEKTILDADTGYRYNPKVTSGPYNFITFDKENMQAIVTANPLFKGDYAGDVPQIETIVLKKVLTATQMDELRGGTVDLLSQVTDGDQIITGLDIADEGVADYVSYLRSGFGYFSFACEEPWPTSDVNVRQAIAYCIDVPEFARAFTKGYGQVVYGYYGAAQWMAQANKAGLADKMNTYALNLETAKEKLIEGGWVYDAEGNDYVSGVRYRKLEDGTLQGCIISWASTVDNAVSDLLLQMLPDNALSVGIQIDQTTMQFAELLEYSYQPNTVDVPDGRNGFSMFNMATNFTSVFDPYYTYHTDDRYLGVNNSSGLQDEQLTDLAFQMRNLEGTETEKYAEIWLDWQVRWNELIPMVPLYSNEYFDFFNAKLKGLDTNPLWNWYWAILQCTVEE